MHIYNIYEKERLVFTGTAKEVRQKFNLRSDMSMGTYTTRKRNFKIHGKYDVKVCDKIERKAEQDTTWDCLHMMLVVKKEKKTSVSKDPHKYVDRLKKLGVDVKITPYMSLMIKDTDISSPPKDKRKPQRCWYVERV